MNASQCFPGVTHNTEWCMLSAWSINACTTDSQNFQSSTSKQMWICAQAWTCDVRVWWMKLCVLQTSMILTCCHTMHVMPPELFVSFMLTEAIVVTTTKTCHPKIELAATAFVLRTEAHIPMWKFFHACHTHDMDANLWNIVFLMSNNDFATRSTCDIFLSKARKMQTKLPPSPT